MLPAANAGHAVKAARRAEHDAAVGQITRVVVVDVGFVAGCYLAQTRAVGLHLEDLPTAMCPDRGEEHARAIAVQIDVAHEGPVGRLEQRRALSSGAPR